MTAKKKKNSGRPSSTPLPLKISVFYTLSADETLWSAQIFIKNIAGEINMEDESASVLFEEVISYLKSTYGDQQMVVLHTPDTAVTEKFAELVQAEEKEIARFF